MREPLQKYASYNVLARKALMAGVPVITLIIIITLILFTGVIGILTMGLIKGVITPLLLCALLFYIRVKCIDDSRAMEGVMWDLKGALSRLKCRSNVTSFTSIDESDKKRRSQINEFYQLNNISK